MSGKNFAKQKRVPFYEKYPEQDIFLKCLRKALFIDSEFHLSLRRSFNLNGKEIGVFGTKITKYNLGVLEPDSKTDPKGGRLILNLEVFQKMKFIISKIKYEI